ncbi:GNAT family N-acetyltransferase [bacterium]|nr:MAG: GNAT family N-acetyltransferase [bacterium]
MRNDTVLQEVRELADGARLRPIRDSDDPEVSRIIREVMTEFAAVGEGFSIEDAEVGSMTRSYAAGRAAYYVIDDGGKVLGGAGIGPLPKADDDVCELKKMYILRSARNRGLGRALMERCLEAASRLGYRKVYLETLDSMVRARALYARYGFAPIEAPMGATGHFGCDRWFLRELSPAFSPLNEGDRWVDL